MKITRKLRILCALIIVLVLITACGKTKKEKAKDKEESSSAEEIIVSDELSDEAKKICGSWAYNHDDKTEIAAFNEDGTAKYEGGKYKFNCDDEFIKLKDKKGKARKVRYALTDDGMLLYNKTTYTYTGEGKPNSLIGEWSCPEKKWMFTFKDDGLFLEDGYFPGQYSVDYENSTFTLVYTDKFNNTTCYFGLDGKKLNIEYPWPVVKTCK